jgi:hypothetical protein
MGIGGDILGYCCSNSPNIHKNNIGLPQYIYIGDRPIDYWGTGGDALKLHR